MVYTPLTKKALLISFNAHKDQFDKGGLPYVYHPYHVAEQMNDEYSTCVALLHDVVEDTDITIKYLKHFEPNGNGGWDAEPYYLCYSGGKDSDVILALAKLAVVN